MTSEPFPPMALSSEEKALLLKLARQAIEHGLRQGQSMAVDPQTFSPALQEPRAVFVTLRIEEQLRGCIGTIEAADPLVAAVARYAYLSAFSDTRFPEMTWEEFPQLEIQISILSPCTPLVFKSEAELLAQIRPGIDGLVLEDKGHRGTFLPSVWEAIADKVEFVRTLKRKAGLPPDYWSDSIQVSRYTTCCFSSGS